jgi:hypothetical protein
VIASSFKLHTLSFWRTAGSEAISLSFLVSGRYSSAARTNETVHFIRLEPAPFKLHLKCQYDSPLAFPPSLQDPSAG